MNRPLTLPGNSIPWDKVVTNTQSSNVKAFELLYDKNAPQLLGYIMQNIKSRERAEEILSDTFLKVWDILKRGVINDEEKILKILIFSARHYIKLNMSAPF